MALIKDLKDIPDLAPVAEGEYDIRVTKVRENPSKNTGRNSIQLICEIIDEENAAPLFHNIWLPMESDDKDKADTMWRMIKEFTSALGLEGELELEDFEDLEFSALLSFVDDDDFPAKNEIKKVT